MLITFQCTNCNARLRIDSEAIGTELDCPECDAIIQVPNIPFGPGYVVGGFLIKEKIGQGGMGEVFCATDTNIDREVLDQRLLFSLLRNTKDRFIAMLGILALSPPHWVGLKSKRCRKCKAS